MRFSASVLESIKQRIGRVAQLVRAPASHAGGLGFESLRAHHPFQGCSRLYALNGGRPVSD
jgi:hypothetical protein